MMTAGNGNKKMLSEEKPKPTLVLKHSFLDIQKPRSASKLSILSETKRKMVQGKVFVLGDEKSGKSKLITELSGSNVNNNLDKSSRRKKRSCCCACCCFRRRKPPIAKPLALNLVEADESVEAKSRAMNYLDTDVVLLCFRGDSEESFVNLKEKWVPEVQQYSPSDVPLVVACIRNEVPSKKREISFKRRASFLLKLSKPAMPNKHGAELARSINAFAYVECSIRTTEGLQELKDKLLTSVDAVDDVVENISRKNSSVSKAKC